MSEMQAIFAHDSVAGHVREELGRLTKAFQAALEHHMPVGEVAEARICALDEEDWPCRSVKGALAALKR